MSKAERSIAWLIVAVVLLVGLVLWTQYEGRVELADGARHACMQRNAALPASARINCGAAIRSPSFIPLP